MLAQEQVQAGNEEEALNALTQIALQIRVRLDELLAAIGEQPTPLEQATTPSLEALKAFTVGYSTAASRGFGVAVPHLQRAIALDPQFALAQAVLGFWGGNMGQTELGTQYVLKAYALLDRVSDWERHYILFLYHRQVTGNLRKELAAIEAWAQLHPLDFHPWGIMAGWATRGTGLYERGVEAAKESIRLNPDTPFPYDGLSSSCMSLGRFQEARAALQEAAERNLEIPNLLVTRYYLAFLDGDEVEMKRVIDRAQGHRESEDWMSQNQAMVLARSGKMRDARTMWHHAIALAQQNGDPGRAAIYQAAAAVCEAHCGNWATAKERAQGALEFGKGRDVKYAAAFALALSGDDSASQRLAEELAKQFPEDTPVQFEYLPILRALSALAQDAPLKAIEHLLTALPYDLAMPGTAFFARFGGLYTVYVRGQAYMQAGRGQEAAAEFQKVLDHRGIVLADPIGALAHLQLGRVLAVLREKDKARSAYQDFFALWKDADLEIPVLQQAKAEYLKL